MRKNHINKHILEKKSTKIELKHAIIIPLIISIITSISISSLNFIFDFLYYKNQFSTKIYFLDRSSFKNFQLSLPFEFEKKPIIAIKNSNKYNNMTFSSLKINLDLYKIIQFLPNNKEEAYAIEIGILKKLHSIVNSEYYISHDKKEELKLNLLKEKYENKTLMEYYTNKLKDILDLDKNNILKKTTEKYVYYSNKNNYNNIGEILKYFLDEFNIDIDINYAYFLDEYPIEIKSNETKLIKIPDLLIKLTLFSKNGKMKLCFSGSQCEEIKVPDEYLEKMSKNSNFIPFNNIDNMEEIKQKFNALLKNLISKKSLEDKYEMLKSFFIPEFKEIDTNMRIQYFGKDFSSNDYLIYSEMNNFLFQKYKKSCNNFIINNDKETTLLLKNIFNKIEDKYNELPPQILLSYLENSQKNIQNILISKNRINACDKICKNIDNIILLIRTKGNIGVITSKIPELKPLIKNTKNEIK